MSTAETSQIVVNRASTGSTAPTKQSPLFTVPFNCFWIAAIGLALEGTAGEFMRFTIPPTFAASFLDECISTPLCLLAVVVTLVFARRCTNGFVFQNRFWAFVACIGFSAGLLLYFQEYIFDSYSAPLNIVGYYIVVVSAYLYMLIWFERIFQFGLKSTLLTVSASLLMRGCFQALLLFMREVPSTFLLVIIPLISLPCLLRVFAESEATIIDALPRRVQNNVVFMSQNNKLRIFVVLLLLLFFLSSLTNVANRSESLAVIAGQLWQHGQLVCILANIIAGLILLLFASSEINKTSLFMFFFTCVALTCVALYGVSTLSGLSGSGNLLFVLALRIARKALDFAVVFPAFIFNENQPEYWRYVASRLIVITANCLINFTLLLLTSYEWLSTLFMVISLVSLFVPLALLIIFLLEENGDSQVELTEEPTVRRPFQEACDQIAAEASLTPTETSVFLLLSRGYNADSIRQELVVSINTAKTHIRNVYMKLGIHSHQDLMKIINDRKKEIQDAYE